jgi:YD repeat-containing protein
MGKLFKFVFFLALVGVLAGGGSYAAAYFAQGKIVGVDDPIGARQAKLYYQGYDSLPGRPRVWVFTFVGGKVPGVRSAMIITSPGGKVILTKPADLADRIQHWRESNQTVE